MGNSKFFLVGKTKVAAEIFKVAYTLWETLLFLESKEVNVRQKFLKTSSLE